MSSRRRTFLRKRLITMFEQKRLTPTDLDLSHIYVKEYDSSQKITKKALSSGVKRAEILTKLYEDETAASKRKTEQLMKQRSSSSSGRRLVAVLRRRVR